MQRVRHANRGRLLPPDTWSYPIWDLHLFIQPKPHYLLVTLTELDLFTEIYITELRGFNRIYATGGVACQQGTLTPPDTWSCPTLGLACVLMSRPIFPELVLSPDLWISNTPRYFSFASYLCTLLKAGFLATRNMTRIDVGLARSYVKLLLSSWKTYMCNLMAWYINK